MASLALGVTDVILTYKNYMEDKKCKDSSTPDYCMPGNLVFTWIAVGIWASIPVFLFGLLCIYRKNATYQQCDWFQLLAYTSALLFTPAMTVISAIEVYKGRNIYYWTATNLDQDDLAKAIIPIVIAVLGFIEHVISLTTLLCLCCFSGHVQARPQSSSAHVYGTSLVDMGRTTVINTIQPTNRIQSVSTQVPYNICRPTANMAGGRFSCGPSYPSTFYPSSPLPSCPMRSSAGNQWTGLNQCQAATPNPAYNFFRS